MEFEPDPAFPPRRPYRGWGGRRAGGGGSKGNLNALKHGIYSRQAHQLIARIALDPEFRRVLSRLRRIERDRRQQDTPADDDAPTQRPREVLSGNGQDKSPPANLKRTVVRCVC